MFDHGKTSLLDYIRNANVVAAKLAASHAYSAYQVTTKLAKK